MLPDRKSAFRAGLWSDFLTGKAPKSALRPAEGRPESRFRFFPGSSLAKTRPGRPISGPEALLRNIEWGLGFRNAKTLLQMLVLDDPIGVGGPGRAQPMPSCFAGPGGMPF